jgi:hypothetical protein
MTALASRRVQLEYIQWVVKNALRLRRRPETLRLGRLNKMGYIAMHCEYSVNNMIPLL